MKKSGMRLGIIIFLLSLVSGLVLATEIQEALIDYTDCLNINFAVKRDIKMAEKKCETYLGKIYDTPYKVAVAKIRAQNETTALVDIEISNGKDKPLIVGVGFGGGEKPKCEFRDAQEKAVQDQVDQIQAALARKEIDKFNESIKYCFPDSLPLSQYRPSGINSFFGVFTPAVGMAMGAPDIGGMTPTVPTQIPILANLGIDTGAFLKPPDKNQPVEVLTYGFGYSKNNDGECERRCTDPRQVYSTQLTGNAQCQDCSDTTEFKFSYLTDSTLREYSPKPGSNTCTDKDGCPLNTKYFEMDTLGKPRCLPNCGFGFARKGEKCEEDLNYCENQNRKLVNDIKWTYTNELAGVKVGKCSPAMLIGLAGKFRAEFEQKMATALVNCEKKIDKYMVQYQLNSQTGKGLPREPQYFHPPDFRSFISEECGNEVDGYMQLTGKEHDLTLGLRIPAWNRPLSN